MKKNNLKIYKSIFISDVHLGTKGCQANKLLEFFKNSRSENLYLVGDIIDVWAMQKTFYWPQKHNDVIQKILRKARHGTNVFYIMGNHDEMLRKFIPMHFGSIKMINRVIHETAKGTNVEPTVKDFNWSKDSQGACLYLSYNHYGDIKYLSLFKKSMPLFCNVK